MVTAYSIGTNRFLLPNIPEGNSKGNSTDIHCNFIQNIISRSQDTYIEKTCAIKATKDRTILNLKLQQK